MAIDVFATPYERWSNRKTTPEEALQLVKERGISLIDALEVKDKLIESVFTHAEAAAYMLRQRADNGLESHIDSAIRASTEFRSLRAAMPRTVPAALRRYQNEFAESGLSAADAAINAHGTYLTPGQKLFHGGHWSSTDHSVTTTRPFSTSFCPQVAYRNGEWKGKAFKAGRLDLMLITVDRPGTKAYVFDREGEKGYEKEIVFASGAYLKRIRETYIKDIEATIADRGQALTKSIPAYVLEVEIS